ncbi:30998_t:CDS:2, partial [Gigaspora margarita]
MVLSHKHLLIFLTVGLVMMISQKLFFDLSENDEETFKKRQPISLANEKIEEQPSAVAFEIRHPMSLTRKKRDEPSSEEAFEKRHPMSLVRKKRDEPSSEEAFEKRQSMLLACKKRDEPSSEASISCITITTNTSLITTICITTETSKGAYPTYQITTVDEIDGQQTAVAGDTPPSYRRYYGNNDTVSNDDAGDAGDTGGNDDT